METECPNCHSHKITRAVKNIYGCMVCGAAWKARPFLARNQK